jgi:amidase
MKAAGAIPLARTNLSELGLRLSTDNTLRGRTLNPWNAHLTCGGSSGGDAVALATGMTPLGLGNDLGGSLRSPAYCCGVAALKPTTGRIPRAASLGPMDSGMAVQAMLVDGPMARSVADLRLALSVLAGRDVCDPRSVDVPLVGPEPARRRAALLTRISGVEIPRVTLDAVRRAGNALADAGWAVEEAEPPELDAVHETWSQVLAVDLCSWLPAVRPLISRKLYENFAHLCRSFEASAVSNLEIHARRSRLTRLWSLFFVRYPVLVGPTWTQLPWPPDADLAPGTGLRLLHDTARLLTPANVLGFPAVAVPTGVVDGLPTGVQVHADLWREDLCLAAAETVEAAVGTPTPIDPVP